MSPKAEHAHITDHALVRYMERVLGIDVEAMRASMDSRALQHSLAVGASRITIDGVAFYAKDGKIVTLWNVERDGKARNIGVKKPQKRQFNQKRKGGGGHRRRMGNKGSKR